MLRSLGENHLQSFSEGFHVIDADKIGLISLKEWKHYCAAMGVAPEHAKASFDAMDTSGDGHVSMDEIMVGFFYTADNNLNSSILLRPLE